MTPGDQVDTRGRSALLALARAVPGAPLAAPTPSTASSARAADPTRPAAASAGSGVEAVSADIEHELRVVVLRVAAASLAAERGLDAAARALEALERGEGALAACFAPLADAGGLFACPCPRLDAVTAASVSDALRGADLRGARVPAEDAAAARGTNGGDDEERLGAVHEGMLGVALMRAAGHSVQEDATRAPLDLDAVLRHEGDARLHALAEAGWRRPSARQRPAVCAAASLEALVAALGISTAVVRAPGAPVLQATRTRRRDGAHYTPVELARRVVEAAVAPLLTAAARVVDVRVCDPAVGSGAFLLAAGRYLATHAVARDELPVRDARLRVIERCLYGVDIDPVAVAVARTSLWLHAGMPLPAPSTLVTALRVGDALVGEAPGDAVDAAELAALGEVHAPPALHWPRAFAAVFARGGFDVCVGNPPWVAYAGRAAEPLEPALFDYWLRHNPAFHGYRTLHGLFVQRAAALLRPGGRLGLVVPTSISDLAGYAPVRSAHDALCRVDEALVDFGADAFAGVFQPAMALLSTRIRDGAACSAAPPPSAAATPSVSLPAPPSSRANVASWTLARSDLDAVTERLLARLGTLETLPAEAFGERGFQTTGADASRLRRLAAPEPPFVLPIREGADIAAFVARPPRSFLDPERTEGRLRAADAWGEVRLLIRQTARFPIAALADGIAFRNSILAGFARGGVSAGLLLAWLNSSPVRWYHYMRHRDARQGMPQVKVAHLRSLPAPPRHARAALEQVGNILGERNRGADADAQRALDALAAEALALDPAERAAVARWATSMPVP